MLCNVKNVVEHSYDIITFKLSLQVIYILFSILWTPICQE